MIRVKDLIKELQRCDPDAIVLHAYNEYGKTGDHRSVSTNNMVCIVNDELAIDSDGDIVWLDNVDYQDDDYYDEKFSKETNTWYPAIILYAD